MAYFDKLKEGLAELLEVSSKDLITPPDSSLGHLSLPLFDLAKKKKTDPRALAEAKADFLKKNNDWRKYIKEVKAVGPYLNIFLNKTENIKEILGNVFSLKGLYGFNSSAGRLVMVEHANQNTHKDLHVGHLRNISYGDSVFRLLKTAGRRVLAVSFINDQGINVAKTIWNWKREKKYQEGSEPKGKLLGECYSEAVKKIDKNEDFKNEVVDIMKAIEKRQGDWYRLWRQSRQWSIDYFDKVYKDLDIKLDKIFYESEMIGRGLNIVKDLLAKDILKFSDGAVIADLEEDNLGVMPILRSDGTALYPVADLALALTKFELYDLEEAIYVIDVRQSLHFKQLFKILEKMGYQQKFTHLSYDFVKLKDGLMSSRDGNTVSYEQAFESVYSKAEKETKKRHADWSAEKIHKIAKALAISTLKFEMIKVSQDKIIVFDVDESLRFDGYTAAYLQYTGARINSLLSRGLNVFSRLTFKFKADNLKLDKELELSLMLARYPEKVRQAADEHNPSIVARYLFDLAQQFNDYYQAVNILKVDKKTRQSRLALAIATQQVLKNGFDILGLKYLKKM